MWKCSRRFGLSLLFLLLCSSTFSSTYFEISEEELNQLETTLERQETRLARQAETLSELANIIEMQQSVLENQSSLIGTLGPIINQLEQSFNAYEREVRRERILTITGSAGAGFVLGFVATLFIGGR
jgi:uncharacterized coiled-coil protein SlyX